MYLSVEKRCTLYFIEPRRHLYDCYYYPFAGMDEEALRGLNPISDPQLQRRALQYFEQLKSLESGWKLCAEAFVNGSYHGNDHVKFFCLQVIEHYLKTGYNQAILDDHQNIKSFIARCLQLQGSEGTQDRSFIRNKIAQIISLAFVHDYPHRWPSFFTDLLQTVSPNHHSIDIYLRVLLAIDSDVVDREIVHTPEEFQRNTLIKDAMREQAVGQLAGTWYEILTTYETSNPEVVCMCLDVIGKFISWIDINLIANDKFVTVLLNFMTLTLIRESACDCITDILNKGMDPIVKTKLVESFTNVLEERGILSPVEDEEGDFLAKLSKLVNAIGVNLILAWQKLLKTEDKENTEATLQALESKVPLMFRFLSDEDDDVSGAVAQFSQEYIALLKQMKPLSQKQRENMEGLLYIVIKKMTYDESYDFEHEGEEEAMFQEYRKQLKTIFNNLAALDAQLIIVTVHNILTQTLPNWERMDQLETELAISLLYQLGEALPEKENDNRNFILQATQGQHFSGDLTKASVLQEMMRLLITSRVSCQGHMSVMLQFFETVVRYDKFFSVEPQHIPDVLMAFTDERGFRHRSAQVRSRASYLFSRFVKGVRSHIHNYVEEILQRIQDLLVLNTPDNGYQHLLSSDDQLFLYETAGSLIVCSNLPSEKKQTLMKNLLSPIATKFESLLTKLVAETNQEKQLAYAQSINTATALASRVSKGFSSQQTMQVCGCVDTFTDLLRLFLQAVNVPIHRQLIHTGVRQYLHRMVVCMEKEILPFVPVVLENLLKQPDARELHDFLPLMNQMIMKFKSAISPFLQEVFMPLVSTIYQVLTTPTDELDQVTANDKKMLQRSYYLFICTIVCNDVLDVLKNQDMQNLNQVLITFIQGAVDIPDPQSQKMCFNILRKLVDSWGGNDGMAGFVDFMYKSIIPACLMAPMKPSFDLNDGQTSLALGECSNCLREIYGKRGDEMIQYLLSEYLPTLQLSQQQTEEFCQVLKADSKLFRTYFKNFFMKAKS
ncbi:exportin-T-like isoform X1 [Mytilus californianus]|uniref:exportin-T-like isoform X1 n=2 Tax=Mytilus californianus TaxID=6549 RepID=UPI002245F426|nr:exportin-T-like isoform X1 [Mytilus californianus]